LDFLQHGLSRCRRKQRVPFCPSEPLISRTFEFRAVSKDPKADGETDFKGKTAVFSTEERVAFLNVYADYASAWFGDPKLDTLAAPPAETKRGSRRSSRSRHRPSADPSA